MVLLLVLAGLAIMMLLLVALLEGSAHQISGAENAAERTEERLLADSAVALVMGQIEQATTQTGHAWISQPGLLRVYDTTASRRPVKSYKLYSSSQMNDTSGTLGFLAGDLPADWASTPNLYTDLNAPVQAGLFAGKFYPILDPGAADAVEDVSFDAGHGVEMPVAWIYEMRDGTLGPASLGTAANPIVGRLAFWTDDETCKVNINTAGCGTVWETPRAHSTDDVAWSTRQPVAGDYACYPGHPATTTLETVFGPDNGGLTAAQLLGLTPRYPPGAGTPAKGDRLYASLDELCFGTGLGSTGGRMANPLTARQVDVARFVLTAHSDAPETTLLGEPRISIWPLSDSPDDATLTTPTDRAFRAAATVGARNYFFQRHDPLSPSLLPGDLPLFQELVARGAEELPGYGASFTQKYTGMMWPQLLLEIADFSRCLNAVDPAPAPFVSFAPGSAHNVGRAFVVPLEMNDPPGDPSAPLRGLGRCPTFSGLTLVFYVSGFGFKDKTYVDYDETPDADGRSWSTNFDPKATGNRWAQVINERVRAFVVPTTYQPGCAFPEVSDACTLEIDGLDQMKVVVNGETATGGFGFPASAVSRPLSDAAQVLPADRAWGGNEGPLAWRAAALDAGQPNGAAYPFAATTPLLVPLSGVSNPASAAPWSWTISFSALNLTVKISDLQGRLLQSCAVTLPAFTAPIPTVNGEFDHADGATPATSHADWTTRADALVTPSYYMSLRNRLLATQLSRPMLIQAGDISRGIEANTDLRVIAALKNVSSAFFGTHPGYASQALFAAHNLRFADGISAAFATGNNRLVSDAAYPSATLTATPVPDWRNGQTVTYSWSANAACGVPTTLGGNSGVVMANGAPGDWDTGLGVAPDGAQINLPDAGTSLEPSSAYFSLGGGQIGAATQRTPNAVVPSPVILGSLPAGIDPQNPGAASTWRTLLFCPYPAAGPLHPGAATPPDNLLLDQFWMPVVEPYPISTCLATAGKINLNNQIAPFTYLHRRTAFHALLHDLRIPAIPVAQAAAYKNGSAGAIASIWKTVDENATIAEIESRFAVNDNAYLTEGEICGVPLIPAGVTATDAALTAYWNNNGSAGHLTGDNLRELPYAQLYSRLTTRSNSYTVHVRVQTLRKITTDPRQNLWNEATDRVTGEWRGSYEIERYLDPSTLVAPTAAGQAVGPYHFRVVSSRRFAP